MPVLGYPFFEKPKPGELGVRQQTLYFDVSKITAEAFLTPKGIMVRNGSKISLNETQALSGNYRALRKSLSEQGVVDMRAGVFIKDYEFSSPSAAGAVILGYNINGRDAFKTKNGLSINQLEEARI